MFLHYPWHRSVFVLSGPDFEPMQLRLCRVNGSKLLQFLDANPHHIDPSDEEEMADLCSLKDLQSELVRFWPQISSELHTVSNLHFDIDKGRLFLVCGDGIRVIDYK